MMERKPDNWKLVEMYEGNFIFEDIHGEFQVSVDKMGRMNPPFNVHFNQLEGDKIKIGLEDDGAYSDVAFNEKEALQKAFRMMSFISKKVHIRTS